MKRHCLCMIAGVSWLTVMQGASAGEPLQAPGPFGPLSGTFERAAKPDAPVMLIIPGSGPVDRDGDSPAGVAAAPYRLLAEGLARQDVATVRIDKRGMFGSRTAIPDPNHVTIDDYATDVAAWIGVLRTRTGAGCVWLLGHSEGGLVALVAARRSLPVCGLVLVSAPGRPLGAIIRSQLRANPANASILPEALSALQSLEAGRHVDAARLSPPLMPLFRPAVQSALISELALDPAMLIANLRLPILILQGERDLQIGPDDARRLADANRTATLDLLPDVNHVLKTVHSDDRAANIATYADPTLPLAPGIVDRIAAFVAGSGRSR